MTGPNTLAQGVRALIAKGEDNPGDRTWMRTLATDPFQPTPSAFMAAARSNLVGENSITVAELAARDAIGLWAVASTASVSAHITVDAEKTWATGSVGQRIRLAQTKRGGTAIEDSLVAATRSTTRKDLMRHLTRLFQITADTGVRLDYGWLAVILAGAYKGEPGGAEIDRIALSGNLARPYHVKTSTSTEGTAE